MSSEELSDKVKRELIKSGFPLELQCRRELYEHQWVHSLNRTYADSEGVHHEIDAIAVKQASFTSKSRSHNMVNSIIVVECKKNESNHFVFLMKA